MSEGKAKLEIKYCVTWGYFHQAASLAAELADGRTKETNIQLTPVGGGRFEIYVDDVKVYDRLQAGEGDMYRGLRSMREARKALMSALGEPVPAGVH